MGTWALVVEEKEVRDSLLSLRTNMKAEYNKCIKAKATNAAKEAGNKAVKEGAKAASEATTDALKNIGK